MWSRFFVESKNVELSPREYDGGGGNEVIGQGVQSFSYGRWINSGELTSSMVIIVNNYIVNYIVYLEFVKRVDIKC